MATSLHAVDPGVAAYAGEQPCDAGGFRVSRAKQRKMRDRRVAIRHSQKLSAGLRQQMEQELGVNLEPPLGLDAAPSPSNSYDIVDLQTLLSTLKDLVPQLQQITSIFKPPMISNTTQCYWQSEVCDQGTDDELNHPGSFWYCVPQEGTGERHWNVDAKDFVPCLGKTIGTEGSVKGDWRSLPNTTWDDIHERVVEAPVFLPDQEEIDSDSLVSEASSSEGFVCAECGGALRGEAADADYDGDRCDKCSKYAHSRCLLEFTNFRGEWRLCQPCSQEIANAGGFSSVKCDLRSLPEASWNVILSRFGSGMKPPVLEAADPLGVWSSQGKADDQVAVDFSPLDETLDYVVRFLEGGHEKSNKLPENKRSFVLSMVRASLEWKKPRRTQKEIQDKVLEINQLMMALVQKL